MSAPRRKRLADRSRTAATNFCARRAAAGRRVAKLGAVGQAFAGRDGLPGAMTEGPGEMVGKRDLQGSFGPSRGVRLSYSLKPCSDTARWGTPGAARLLRSAWRPRTAARQHARRASAASVTNLNIYERSAAVRSDGEHSNPPLMLQPSCSHLAAISQRACACCANAAQGASCTLARYVIRVGCPEPLARPRTRCNTSCMLCILHDARRVCMLRARPQMVGQKSKELLAVFKKADKKGGDLRAVWDALKEAPCSWGNAQRQYKAWRGDAAVAAEPRVPAAARPTPAAKPAGVAAASTLLRTKAEIGQKTRATSRQVAVDEQNKVRWEAQKKTAARQLSHCATTEAPHNKTYMYVHHRLKLFSFHQPNLA